MGLLISSGRGGRGTGGGHDWVLLTCSYSSPIHSVKHLINWNVIRLEESNPCAAHKLIHINRHSTIAPNEEELTSHVFCSVISIIRSFGQEFPPLAPFRKKMPLDSH